MAVIIREIRELAGKNHEVSVYLTDGLLTAEERERAQQFDQLLAERMDGIIQSARENGLLGRVGTRDTLPLWYHVGDGLQFLDRTELLSQSDRKYVWRAIYDHAGPLHTGDIPERVKRSPETSHFYYCYLLAKKFDWETVEAGGTWTTWVEFFDSRPIREDERIIEWLSQVQNDRRETGLQDWIRPLNRAIRNEFRNSDTSVLTDEELIAKLESLYSEIHGTPE